MTAPKRHIVILGGQAYQDLDPLPEKEPGMEFWAQNAIEQWIVPKVSEKMVGSTYSETDNVVMLAAMVDRWYEIHDADQTIERHPKHMRWLSENRIRVCVQDIGSWPLNTPFDSITYPIDEIEALAPHANYLAGTFSYMVAHAILEGVDKISFHWMAKGALRSPKEPRDAQSSLDYWLGFAEARGIEIDCGDMWLLKSWWGGRYGFDGMPPEWHADRADQKYLEYLREGRWDDYEPVSDDT